MGIQSLLLGGNCPLAVPEKIVGLTLILDFFDRGAKRFSLYLPQAALKSFALYTREPETATIYFVRNCGRAKFDITKMLI